MATTSKIPEIPTSSVSTGTESTYVELTSLALSSSNATAFVRSPLAGATVLFIGTTRNSFNDQPVSSLAYSSYTTLAINTLQNIAETMLSKHSLTKIYIVHRLGEVPIGEESVVIAVSAPHRQEAWKAGEEALEEVKKRAEVWKLEKFEGGEEVWRANRDGAMGVKVGDGEGN